VEIESTAYICAHFTGKLKNEYLQILSETLRFERPVTNRVFSFLKKELVTKVGAPRRIQYRDHSFKILYGPIIAMLQEEFTKVPWNVSHTHPVDRG
jgi:hypothetical protein